MLSENNLRICDLILNNINFQKKTQLHKIKACQFNLEVIEFNLDNNLLFYIEYLMIIDRI